MTTSAQMPGGEASVITGDGRPRVTSPVPRDVWTALLRSDREAVVTQSLAWHDAVLTGGRYQDTSVLYEFPSGQRVVLPLARPCHAPAWAATTASWPGGWSVGGPISENGRIAPAEAAAVLADVARRRTLVTEIRLRPGTPDPWLDENGPFTIEENRLKDYVIDLDGGFAAVWQDKFGGNMRTCVRKGERSGLEVEVDRSGRLLPEFFDLYETSIKRWAAVQREPVWLTRWRTTRTTQPKILAAVAGHFGTGCAVWMARSKGEPAAAIIMLSSGAYAKYWRGAMNKQLAGPRRANELLHRLALEDACQHGCRYYDMGTARPDSQLAFFKEKLGAVPHALYVLRAERLPVNAMRGASQTLVKKMIGARRV
jgi:hypothetical protein